jgi:disulfide bond formation protein DsbB
MTTSVLHALNVVFVFVVCGILLGAFAVQFAAGELPCPLCLLQRLAMLGVGLGATLNVAYGQRPRHYGVALLSAIFGGMVAGRQILLHIAPGEPGYGSAFLGLHLYTWSFVAFVGTGIVSAVMLMFDSNLAALAAQAPPTGSNESDARLGTWPALGLLGRLAILLLITIATVNLACAVLLCGLGPCEGNPTHYELLSR